MAEVELSLTYVGETADQNVLDFYDTAIALVGFQRSLAITTHFVLHDKVITQAPSLKGANIYVVPPEAGSWKIMASIAMAGSVAYTLGTAPRDTPLGNLVSSAYDYVVARTLGFHVDYHSTLGQQYEQAKRAGVPLTPPTPQRLDSVVEKCEVAIKDMHRPIVASRTAAEAKLDSTSNFKRELFNFRFSQQSYLYMLERLPELNAHDFFGRVSSYNVNTYKGRVFIGDAQRPVPFEVPESARTARTIDAIARSLAANARSRQSDEGIIRFRGMPYETRTGRLRGIVMLAAE